MTTIISIRGLGLACTFPGCDKETTYHGKKRTAPAAYEIDGKVLCSHHNPYTEDETEKYGPKPLRLFQVQSLAVNAQSGHAEATDHAQWATLSTARSYAGRLARDLHGIPSNHKVEFVHRGGGEEAAGYYLHHSYRGGSAAAIPMRIVETSLVIGDWVHVGLHSLAQEPDCYKESPDPKENRNRCRNPHQQVGRIVALYKNDVSGWVADVDFQPLTHRVAGGGVYPGGIETLSVVILRKLTPFLRGWEIFEGVRLVKHEEHCAGYIPDRNDKCMKPVLRIFYRWSNQMPGCVTIGQINEDHHLDGIRHADGTGPWDHSLGWTFPRCQTCGFEGQNHCAKCHTGSTIYKQEAYGDRTTCDNPECGRDDWYDIGD